MNRRAWLLVLAAAALLVLRKPWALHTPQLWAEDGSIFLVQDGQMGVRAWLEPYNGYLHLLPRLIAWTASHTADPAWWPAIYNGLAFALTVGVFIRIVSDRVVLRAKPALALALVFVVGSGETLLNVTNLQWVTAFFLVIHLFTRPPENGVERVGDLAVLAVVGLNGPFAVLLLPFFAWRAWREKHLDAWLAVAALGACALTQAYFLSRTSGLTLHEAAEPFHPLGLLATIGSRLVVWPFFGPAAVRAWPAWADALAGVIVLGALLVRAWRADTDRPARTTIAALFTLITLASVYRARADTWNHTDMANGDRYFYIPRVLITWLVIWECGARPRAAAWLARLACGAALAWHAPYLRLPAPPDYHWAEHCEPIRRGTPANIHTLPEGWWIEYPGRVAQP